MHDMLQRALGELVQLEIRSAEDIWCVEIDISQLEASVLNLAVNARDAMPHGGRLVIEVDNSHLDHDYAALFPDAAPGQYVMLRVRDNGHGMDAATLARVFEPFFTTKQVGRGTGLGLSMVHGFVKQSGGHVLIDSVEGGGTSITMMFPRSPLTLPRETRTPQTGLADYSPREETILVAEDNDDVRKNIDRFGDEEENEDGLDDDLGGFVVHPGDDEEIEVHLPHKRRKKSIDVSTLTPAQKEMARNKLLQNQDHSHVRGRIEAVFSHMKMKFKILSERHVRAAGDLYGFVVIASAINNMIIQFNSALP
jgi:hypothetical protein